MSMASIMARLERIERKLNLAEPADDNAAAMRDVRRQLDLIAERRRAQPGWQPSGVSVAVLIEVCRERVSHTRASLSKSLIRLAKR